jgi:hypothetical protein
MAAPDSVNIKNLQGKWVMVRFTHSLHPGLIWHA